MPDPKPTPKVDRLVRFKKYLPEEQADIFLDELEKALAQSANGSNGHKQEVRLILVLVNGHVKAIQPPPPPDVWMPAPNIGKTPV